jgi:hypothetical protein
MTGHASCPRCGRPLVRVSALYLEALEALSRPETVISEALRTLVGPDADQRGALRVRALRGFVGLVAPPAGERRTMRLIPPDAVAGGFALILAVVLVRAWQEQPASAPTATAAAAGALLLYAATRRLVLRRYAAVREREDAARRAVEAGVEAWMELRCCPAERVVDGLAGGDGVPLDDLQRRLASLVVSP